MNRKPVSEKVQLRHEAKYLRKRIQEAEKLLRQRDQVKALRGKLEDLKYMIDNPGFKFQD